MRILHVITRLILGGAQQNTVLSCQAQAQAGHEVHLVYGPIYGPEGSLLDEARSSGAVLHELKPMVRSVHPWKDWRCYVGLKQLIREIQPDLVHTHSSKAGIVGRFAAWRGPNTPPVVLHTVHGLPFHDQQNPLIHKLYVALEKASAKRCHHLIAITPAMVDAFVEKQITARDRFTVIPSGVDLSRFEVSEHQRGHARRELGWADDAPVVAIVARLDPLKGHDDLLDILPELVDQYPELKMLWIGDGWNRPHLEQRINREGLGDRVVMAGLVPHNEVGRLLCAADVKVLPSYQEGQSRTLVEALMCGCGIVAYRVGGIPSICIDGRTGWLTPVGNKTALTQAIARMLSEPDERARMVASGQAHVRDVFSAERMNQDLLTLYHRWVDPPSS